MKKIIFINNQKINVDLKIKWRNKSCTSKKRLIFLRNP